jgi:hypothetical protein
MYEDFGRSNYAEWSIESMYLISVVLKVGETKILDIAYLLLLKLMKEKDFKIDKKFIGLYVKCLIRQCKYQEALDFIDSQAKFYESDKHSRQTKEAALYHSMGNPVLTINVFFNMLRANNNAHLYKEIWNEYMSVIRIVLFDYAKRNNYKYCKEDIDTMI